MDLPNRITFPNDLLLFNKEQEDINILVGENGTGKSTLLHDLAKNYLRRGKQVIAIANSIHDKFEIQNPKFKVLRGRSGRRMSRLTIKHALQNIAEGDEIKFKNAARVLAYVGFDKVIGVRFENLASNFDQILLETKLTDFDKSNISSLLNKLYSQNRRDEIIWLSMEAFIFDDFERISLLKLLPLEKQLKDLGIINKIEIYLRKRTREISMFNASSGEIAMITTIIYISTAISDNTAILIDEPENSLHPKWQKEYVQTLVDLFYLYQPKIVLATHSPIIVNGGELFVKSTKIFKGNNFKFLLQENEPLNVEELMFKFFDLNTPQSHYLSERMVRLMNFVANEKISLNQFNSQVNQAIQYSYDPKQIEVLNALRIVAEKISSSNKQ